jgi:predicted nucleic acid-binding protein
VSTLFADTFHFVALLNPRDQHHPRAHKVSDRRDMEFITTRAVLLEVGDAFASVETRTLAAEFLHTVEEDPRVLTLPFTFASPVSSPAGTGCPGGSSLKSRRDDSV